MKENFQNYELKKRENMYNLIKDKLWNILLGMETSTFKIITDDPIGLGIDL